MYCAFEVVLFIVFMTPAQCGIGNIMPSRFEIAKSIPVSNASTHTRSNLAKARRGKSTLMRSDESVDLSTKSAVTHGAKDQNASVESWTSVRKLFQQREAMSSKELLEEEEDEDQLSEEHLLDRSLSRKGPPPDPACWTKGCCDDEARRRDKGHGVCVDWKKRAACDYTPNARRRNHVDEARKTCRLSCGVCQAPCGNDGDCASKGLVGYECEAGKCKEKSLCDESRWPDVDGASGGICGDCKVLIKRFSAHYRTCNNYCKDIGMGCKAAWEEESDTCQEKHSMKCDETKDTSDAICECFHVGKCKDITCSAGTFMPDENYLCTGKDCTQAECCQDFPRCETFTCSGGSKLLDGTKQCQGKECTFDECCQAGECEEGPWPDKDKGLICGDCKVLVDKFDKKYKTCTNYCIAVGFQCTGGWEEVGDTCEVKHSLGCDKSLKSSDAICECAGSKIEPTPDPTPKPTKPTAVPTPEPPFGMAFSGAQSTQTPLRTMLIIGAMVEAALLVEVGAKA